MRGSSAGTIEVRSKIPAIRPDTPGPAKPRPLLQLAGPDVVAFARVAVAGLARNEPLEWRAGQLPQLSHDCTATNLGQSAGRPSRYLARFPLFCA